MASRVYQTGSGISLQEALKTLWRYRTSLQASQQHVIMVNFHVLHDTSYEMCRSRNRGDWMTESWAGTSDSLVSITCDFGWLTRRLSELDRAPQGCHWLFQVGSSGCLVHLHPYMAAAQIVCNARVFGCVTLNGALCVHTLGWLSCALCCGSGAMPGLLLGARMEEGHDS